MNDSSNPPKVAKPNADEVLDSFKRGVISAHNNNYGVNVWNTEDYAQDQAKQTMASDLISMLPEKRSPGDGRWNYTEGYNDAIDQATEAIRRYFNDM